MRVARHPSESEEYLVTRILAYALEFCEGIAFSSGLSDPDEPAISVRDLTGTIQSWIDIGIPDAARLHKASKAAPRVAVYTHKDPTQLVNRLSGERIHRVEELELYAVDRRLIGELAARLDRRTAFGLSISEGDLYISIGTDTLTGRSGAPPYRVTDAADGAVELAASGFAIAASMFRVCAARGGWPDRAGTAMGLTQHGAPGGGEDSGIRRHPVEDVPRNRRSGRGAAQRRQV